MDHQTLGLIGGIAGTIIGGIGAYLGARASYQSAANDEQRLIYQRVFRALVPIVLVFGTVIWLVAAGLLPKWLYFVAMGAWFGALPLAIIWGNRRLAELAGSDRPV